MGNYCKYSLSCIPFQEYKASVHDKFRLSEALRKRETASNKIEYYT